MTKNQMTSIGKAIVTCRKDNNLSQQGLGNKFTPIKSASEISRWERNKTKPSAKHMMELLNIFGEQFHHLISCDR